LRSCYFSYYALNPNCQKAGRRLFCAEHYKVTAAAHPVKPQCYAKLIWFVFAAEKIIWQKYIELSSCGMDHNHGNPADGGPVLNLA
jgi:hypothetical protein